MKPYVFDVDPATVDPDGIAENQTTGGAANLVLNGALADLGTALQFDIGDSYSDGCGGVRIAIDSAGDISTVVFTVTGKNQYGFDTTETITGVTTVAVESVTYWSQITQIAADAAVTSNVFVGPVDEIITTMLPINYRAHEPATHAVDVTGTIDYTIEETLEEVHPQLFAGTPENLTWYPITALTAQTTDLKEPGELHTTAVRLVVNSYATGGELKWVVFQNED